jgi:hypothetical protein
MDNFGNFEKDIKTYETSKCETKSACSSTFFLMAGYTIVPFQFSPLHCNTVPRYGAVPACTKVQAPHTSFACVLLFILTDRSTLLPLLFHHTNFLSVNPSSREGFLLITTTNQ